MKKRSGIVLALCAIVGATSIYACSDDSGKKTNIPDQPGAGLRANPTSVSMNYGQPQVVTLTGEASAIVDVVNNNDACVQTVPSVQLDARGNGSLNLQAVDDSCAGRLDLSDGTSSVVVTYNVAASDTPVLNVSASSLDIAKRDDSATFTATYKLNGAAQDGKISVSSDNASCAAPELASYDLVNGEATVKVIAYSEDCNAKLTVSVGSDSKIVNVAVSHVEVGDATLAFDRDNLEIAYAAGEGPFTIEYTAGDGSPINDGAISLSLDSNDCVSISSKNVRTQNGLYSGKVTVQNSNCDAVLTATDGKATATLPIHVNTQDKYDVRIEADYDSNKYSTIKRVMLFYSDAACDMNALSTTAQNYASGAEFSETVSGGVQPVLYTFNVTDLEVTKKSVIVTAKAEDNDRAPVTAYGCKDISVNDQNTIVKVDMVGVPADIKGTYDVISNFDLTSGFTKPPKSEYNLDPTTLQYVMPMVENMSAGAWIQFVVDFCKDPVSSLLAFIWSNTLDRLGTIDGMPDWLKSFLTGDGTKSLALGTLKPLIEKYLTEYNWYNTLTTITPDVADLTTNMQLVGTFKIDSVNGTAISSVEEKFQNLEYQWSLKKDGNNLCLQSPDHYVKDGTCRKNLPLGDNAITGNWDGSIDYAGIATADGSLDIDKHGITFKWGSVLFTAVFGAILPEALGYPLETGTSGKTLYIKSFLDGVVFTPLINMYLEKYNDKDVTNDEGETRHYPALTQTETCNKGIETIVYLIYPDAATNSLVKTGITMAANLACGEQGVGQLDTLVFNSLNKIEASSENTFKLYSDDCALYDGGTLQYQQFGKADLAVYTANEILGQNKKTDRCNWDIDVTLKKDVKDSEGNVTGQTEEHVDVKGFFHAIRKN